MSRCEFYYRKHDKIIKPSAGCKVPLRLKGDKGTAGSEEPSIAKFSALDKTIIKVINFIVFFLANKNSYPTLRGKNNKTDSFPGSESSRLKFAFFAVPKAAFNLYVCLFIFSYYYHSLTQNHDVFLVIYV